MVYSDKIGKVKETRLGEFEVTSGALRVTDPCYDEVVWCSGTVDNVKNGTWEAFIMTSDFSSWGNRVIKLLANHKDYEGISKFEHEDVGFEVGVDSGQAGIFDLEEWRKMRHDFKDEWYGDICGVTNPAGVIPWGVATRSGFGDGGYFAEKYLKDGKVVGIEVVFIVNEDAEKCEYGEEDCGCVG